MGDDDAKSCGSPEATGHSCRTSAQHRAAERGALIDAEKWDELGLRE